MTRAEEQALEVYPIKKEWMGNQWDGVLLDVNLTIREGFIEGYKQAEKDLMADAIETTIDGKVVKVIVIDE